jgi:hypothetical protein
MHISIFMGCYTTLNNLAPKYPEIVQKLEKELDASRTPSKEFPLFSKK